MRTGKLLLDDLPLVVIPELATRLGLNEAIILQQVHYWVGINSKKGHNQRDGHYWTYNTFKEWQAQFPFWSLRTIKTVVKNLERSGLLISSNFNKMKTDRTKWYRVNYDACTLQSAEVAPPTDQTCTMEDADIAPPVPETNTETSSDTNTHKKHHGFFENVLLTEDDFGKLQERFGSAVALDKIEELSHAMASKGLKYKNHYATILAWDRRDGKNGKDRRHPEADNAGLRDSIGKPLG